MLISSDVLRLKALIKAVKSLALQGHIREILSVARWFGLIIVFRFFMSYIFIHVIIGLQNFLVMPHSVKVFLSQSLEWKIFTVNL